MLPALLTNTSFETRAFEGERVLVSTPPNHGQIACLWQPVCYQAVVFNMGAINDGISDGHAMIPTSAMHADQSNSDGRFSVRREKQQQTPKPTTVFFRNVPNNCNGKRILELLDTNGFKDSYDFIYMPHDFKRLPSLVTLGYFFVNFLSHDVAVKALEQFKGFKDWSMWSMESTKVLDVLWATQTQGLKACIRRYRNCPVMHETVPLECKPMVFEKGVMIPLSPSKGQVKQPRFKKGYLPEGKLGLADSSLVEVLQECVDEVAAVEEIGAHSTHSRALMQDESACECFKCAEMFTALRHPHECWGCGHVFCATCAPRTTSGLLSMSKWSQDPSFKRMCKDCNRGLVKPTQGREVVAVKNTFIDVKDTALECRMIRLDTI